ncbi:amino acid ABC transporter [Marinobacter sp. EhC06]|jgi:polar amino acid transport system substrate-binding protein|uniref:substrate-binding periplasmic protein n=1 Tax=Marinobacter TaxID=2742 RepID=UPI0007D9DDA4|nr:MULTISPECIES: transporter substrate-binding domain-containing protein [unclassified Marinobacter]OAN93662.1 amino acid ABC transporter [Marinobacter sp. EhC06]OAN94742.1 amino acid ABC transporter [Marinobacter sp. EhN04]
MKARVQSYLALIPLCLFLAASLPAVAETVLHVAYEDKTQFPYYMGDTEKVLENPGAAVELVRLVEERIPGLRIKFSRYPWKRCLAMLETGQVDGIFNASYNAARTRIGEYPRRDGQVDPTRRLTTISYHLYALPDTDLGWSGEAFKDTDLEIGAPLGYSIVNDLEQLGVSVMKVRSSRQSLQLLIAGRVHAVALQSVTADFLLSRNADQLPGIVRIEPPLKTKPYYLMLSREFKAANPELAEQIWDAIGELREEKLETLAQPYLSEPG